MREALEEAACHFVPQHLVGVYSWRHAASDITYVRFAYCGDITGFDVNRKLDTGIVGTTWMSAEALRAHGLERLRSPLVLRCVDDYLAGRRYPLDLVAHVD